MADSRKPDDKHPDYLDNWDVWRKCRDAYAGQRAIKRGLTLYLPALSGQKDKNGALTADYLNYLDRANFFNATGRTVKAMIGLVFRKKMAVEVPESIKEWEVDITLTKQSLQDFAKACLGETIIASRCGILVDMPQADPGAIVTQAQARANRIRPYFSLYKTESIINWEYALVNNAYCLFNVWLLESYKNDQGEAKDQVRQLTIENGYYEQVIWREGAGPNGWYEYRRFAILKNGQSIDHIPFFPISEENGELAISPPPIEALVDVNISHYKNSADLENGAHMAGQPTLFITGHHPDKDQSGAVLEPVKMGSSVANYLPEENAKAQFVQVGTEGFASLEKLMDRKEAMMAALGARMLAPEKKDAEAAQTHEIKRGGENSVLGSIAGVVERQLQEALTFAAEWQGITGTISVELNRDFFPWNMDLTAWVAARQAGEISKETFFEALQYGDMVNENLTFEEEQERIKNDGPSLRDLNNED